MIFPEAFRHAGQDPFFSSNEGDTCGMFIIPPQKLEDTLVSCSLKVIATDGMVVVPHPATGEPEWMNTGWEHVSVSPLRLRRCPTWLEMEMVRNLFWEPEATVVQLSVPRSKHISINNFCLHMWRSTLEHQPLPPSIFV